MMNKVAPHQLLTPKKLQRTFEHAVRDIYEVSVTGTVSDYRRPIAQRIRAEQNPSPAEEEKRAVADAAKALAQLWKVSPSPSR